MKRGRDAEHTQPSRLVSFRLEIDLKRCALRTVPVPWTIHVPCARVAATAGRIAQISAWYSWKPSSKGVFVMWCLAIGWQAHATTFQPMTDRPPRNFSVRITLWLMGLKPFNLTVSYSCNSCNWPCLQVTMYSVEWNGLLHFSIIHQSHI